MTDAHSAEVSPTEEQTASTPEFDDEQPFVDEELDESPVVNPAGAQGRALAQVYGSKRNSTEMSQGHLPSPRD